MPAERPLAIALVHAADAGGGAERVVLTLHRALNRLGHRSTLYVGRRLTDEPGVVEIPRCRGVPGLLRLTLRLDFRWGVQNLYAPWFRRLRETFDPRPDVVHLHSLWGSERYADLGGIPLLARRHPTLATLHDSWLLTGHCAYPMFPARCERWRTGCGRCPDLTLNPAVPRDATRLNWLRKRRALRRAPLRVTAPSRWLRDLAAASPILAGKQVVTVTNGVDDAVFCPGDAGAARARLGLSAGTVVILLAGQSLSGDVKGTPDAVEALNRLAGRDVAVLLAGRDDERTRVLLALPSMPLGFIADPARMADCYRAADLTLMPSRSEVFGMVAAESAACGTPVLAYAAGGLPEVVPDGVAGLVVPPGDTEALTAALRRLSDDADLRRRLGAGAAAWAAKALTARHMAKLFVEQYRDLCGRPGQTAGA